MNVRLNKAQVIAAGARSTLAAAALLLAQLAISAHAGPNEQAKRIYERIAGEPPPANVLASMANAITIGCGSSGCVPGSLVLRDAALSATQAPSFYNVTLKN